MRVLQLVVVIGILVCSINGDTDPSDAAALRVMFSGLNFPQQLNNWTDNGGDPCGESWKGITCSGSRVTEIKLSGLSLTGNMGYQLSSLTAVTYFDISNNSLGISLPYQLPPNVQQLNFAGCGFSGLIPYSISEMTTLKSLNLGHNQLQGQLFEMFDQLSSLSMLDLSFNSLIGELPESFGSLSSMNSMYLQNNQFTGTIDILANLPLDNLNVSNNHFSGWVPSQLKNISIQKDGNTFNSGPAPPPPPGNGNSPNAISESGGKKKSGIGGRGVAGIMISLLVVSAIVAFFVIKKRSRKRPSVDEEKAETQPLGCPSQTN